GGDDEADEALYEALPLPRSIRELVGRRLDELSRGGRQTLERCSVLGRELDERVLGRMGRTSTARRMEAIGELLARQILEEVGARGGGSVLRFVHDQIHEVAYERIVPRRRRELHRSAANAITQIFGPEARGQLAVLGHHYERAGNSAKARECYLAAARDAAARYAHAEAERLYLACLALAEGPSLQSIAAHNGLAAFVLGVQGRHSE